MKIYKFKDNFSFCSFSLNDISLYFKQKKNCIHRRKVLDSLCSRSCIVPFELVKKDVYICNEVKKEGANSSGSPRPKIKSDLDEFNKFEIQTKTGI